MNGIMVMVGGCCRIAMDSVMMDRSIGIITKTIIITIISNDVLMCVFTVGLVFIIFMWIFRGVIVGAAEFTIFYMARD